MLFAGASIKVGEQQTSDELVAAIKDVAAQFKANQKQLNEIYQFVQEAGGLSNVPQKPNIRVWTNFPGCMSNGATIDQSSFDDFLIKKDRVDILIVDNGQCKARKIGVVFVKGVPLLEHPAVQNSNGIKFTGAGYRWLIHLLKNNGNSGTSLDVAKAVWRYDGAFINRMEAAWAEHQGRPNRYRNPFQGIDGRVRLEKSYLSLLLKSVLDIALTVDSTSYVSKHIMDRVPSYWLAEIQTG